MKPRCWLGAANRRRVLLAAGAVACLLTLPPAVVFVDAGEEIRSSIQLMAAIEVGIALGLIAPLGPRRPGAGGQREAWSELARAATLAAGVWTGVVLAHLASLVWLIARGRGLGPDPWAAIATAVVPGVIAAVATVGAYALGRGVAFGWSAWDRVRRSRLRWALTHALLVASLALAVVVATLLTANDWSRGFAQTRIPAILPPSAGRVETVLALITLQFVPSAIALFLLSLVVGVIIVPPVALIAFPVLGRATRRVEDLAGAAGALRRGDLGARVPVAGEDEIARLQADFNAMAADLERALGELRAERDAVARLLEARRELVAAVSHELRTPVATLRGYLDSALAHGTDGPSPTLRHDLEVMSEEAGRLQRLIDDLFTLSRVEVGRLALTVAPTAVAAVLRRCVAAAAPLAWDRGRVEVLAQVPDELPPALADPARLEQVVGNLVTNAVRHTPPGGLVLVTAEVEADAVVLRVRDTGEGIAAADLPQIWDRFFRTAAARDRDQTGAGLGLALVKELTGAMGGSVAVESAPGEGSCFTVRLPLAADDRRPVAAGASGSDGDASLLAPVAELRPVCDSPAT